MAARRRQRDREGASAEAARPEPDGPLARLGRSPVGYIAASVALIVPCFWQSRIQAGDLASHTYNAWLAQRISAGEADGLAIVPQHTNVLFDLILGALFDGLGANMAERIAVSVAVLIFAWGAFAFASAVAGRRAWHVLPIIGMLAYGWVFHIGFFNFYLALGLCSWALALAWNPRPGRLAAALPLLALAWFAHALPVAWAAALMAHAWIANRIAPRRRGWLVPAALGAIVLASAAIRHGLASRWSWKQILLVTGADQLRVYDGRYWLPFAGLLVVWALLFLRLVRATGARRVVSGTAFQFWLLTAAGVALVPGMIKVPGYEHALAFIAERMSLAVAICACALVATARPRALERVVLAVTVVLFATLLWRDERRLNAFEDRVHAIVAVEVPASARVISGVRDPTLRINALAHMIDRACIGRCFSYANYEASTGQFRIRATRPNGIVATAYEDSWAMQAGRYVVRDRDLPLYQVILDDTGMLTVRSLPAGFSCGWTRVDAFSGPP